MKRSGRGLIFMQSGDACIVAYSVQCVGKEFTLSFANWVKPRNSADTGNRLEFRDYRSSYARIRDVGGFSQEKKNRHAKRGTVPERRQDTRLVSYPTLSSCKCEKHGKLTVYHSLSGRGTPCFWIEGPAWYLSRMTVTAIWE